MVNERLKDLRVSSTKSDARYILNLAKQSHENYLVRSTANDLENAVLYYLEAIKINPELPEAYCKLASLLLEKGQIDVESALEECRKALRIDPKSKIARLYSGYFLKSDGRFKEAEKEFKAAINLNRFFSAKPRLALGLTIIQRERSFHSPRKSELCRGLYYFSTGLLMFLWDFDAIKVLGKSFWQDLKVSAYSLTGALSKKAKKYNLAMKIYHNAAERTGKLNMYYSEIGDLAIESGNFRQALEYYKKSLKSSPDNAALWAKLANLIKKHDKDNIAELKDCYSNIAKIEPDNARAYYELGHVYLKQDDRLSASNAFRRASEIEPKNAYYHNSFAYSLVQLEDYDTAIAEYQKAIKLNPDNVWTSIVSQALGAIYHQVKENIDAAIVSYHMAIVLDPMNIDAYIALGEAHHENQDLDSAIDCYCQAIKLDPEVPKLYSNLGRVLWERDYIDEAIVAYQKALSIDPKYASALNNLGVVYLDGAGKPDEALITFSRAIKCNPNYALAYYNKGRAYQVIGNKMSAAKYYQMAMDINKFTEEIDEIEIEDRLFKLFSAD